MTTVIDSLWERTEDAEDGSHAWLGTFLDDEERLVLITVANEKGNLWGWYEDTNPAFAFDHATLIETLAVSPEDAHDVLLAKVSPEARRRGCPFYV